MLERNCHDAGSSSHSFQAQRNRCCCPVPSVPRHGLRRPTPTYLFSATPTRVADLFARSAHRRAVPPGFAKGRGLPKFLFETSSTIAQEPCASSQTRLHATPFHRKASRAPHKETQKQLPTRKATPMTTTNSSLHDAPQISAKPAPGEKERCVLAYSGARLPPMQ